MPEADEFFDRLRGLNQQARRIATSEEEILQEFIETTEAFTLAHNTPTADQRAALSTKYIWTTVTGATQIKWGEWLWKVYEVLLLEDGDALLLEDGDRLQLELSGP